MLYYTGGVSLPERPKEVVGPRCAIGAADLPLAYHWLDAHARHVHVICTATCTQSARHVHSHATATPSHVHAPPPHVQAATGARSVRSSRTSRTPRGSGTVGRQRSDGRHTAHPVAHPTALPTAHPTAHHAMHRRVSTASRHLTPLSPPPYPGADPPSPPALLRPPTLSPLPCLTLPYLRVGARRGDSEDGCQRFPAQPSQEGLRLLHPW